MVDTIRLAHSTELKVKGEKQRKIPKCALYLLDLAAKLERNADDVKPS